MSVISSSCLSALFWFGLAVLLARRKGNPLHYGVFLALLFILNYPIKLIATELGVSVIDSSYFGAEWQMQALLLSNISAFCFFVPAFLFTKRAAPNLGVVKKQIAWWWGAISLLLYAFTFGQEPIMSLVSTAELRDLISLRGELRMGSAFSALLLQGAQVCLIVFCLSVAQASEKISLKQAALLLLIYLPIAYGLLGVSGSKNLSLQPMAFLILALNWANVRRGRPWALSKVLLLGVLGVCFIALTGYLRAFADSDTIYPNGRLMYAVSQLMSAFDAPDNLAVILYRMDNIWWGDLGFRPTFENLILAVIPRFLWTDKPLLMGNSYIMSEYIPERFTDYTGEVLVPSMAGEMILSGGITFMIPWSFLLGCLYVIFYNYAHKEKSSRISVVLYLWLTLNIFNLLRSGTGIIAPFLVVSGVALIVLKVGGILGDVFTARSQKRQMNS